MTVPTTHPPVLVLPVFVTVLLATGCGHATTAGAPAASADAGVQAYAEAGVEAGLEAEAGVEAGLDTVEAAVLAEIEAYYADFSARDWDAFASHFWPGATITTAWQPPGEEGVRVVVTPIPDFVAQAPQGPGSREVFEEGMTAADVRVTGNLAQVWARYSARFGDPGEIMEWAGTDAFTLMWHDGRWKIIALAFTSDP